MFGCGERGLRLFIVHIFVIRSVCLIRSSGIRSPVCVYGKTEVIRCYSFTTVEHLNIYRRSSFNTKHLTSCSICLISSNPLVLSQVKACLAHSLIHFTYCNQCTFTWSHFDDKTASSGYPRIHLQASLASTSVLMISCSTSHDPPRDLLQHLS